MGNNFLVKLDPLMLIGTLMTNGTTNTLVLCQTESAVESQVAQFVTKSQKAEFEGYTLVGQANYALKLRVIRWRN